MSLPVRLFELKTIFSLKVKLKEVYENGYIGVFVVMEEEEPPTGDGLRFLRETRCFDLPCGAAFGRSGRASDNRHVLR